MCQDPPLPLDPLRVAEQIFPFQTDPARVSHLPVRQSVRHPGGVEVVYDALSTGHRGLRPSICGYEAGTHKGCNSGLIAPPESALLQKALAEGFCPWRIRAKSNTDIREN